VPKEEERKPILVRVTDTFKENPLLFIILLILGIVIIFLIARKKGISGDKPKRIVERHFFDQKPEVKAPPAEGTK
jgi:hypothetical protein